MNEPNMNESCTNEQSASGPYASEPSASEARANDAKQKPCANGAGRKPRVIVAMSGGVDSSASAMLLQDQGYEVIGVTMKLFRDQDLAEAHVDDGGNQSCCSLDDIEDARMVAARLGFNYYVFNFADDFNRLVIDQFCESYLRGETPNPCIECNRHLKFKALQQRRREIEFDYVATGHYARIAYDEARGRFLLKRGLDPNKDQSYVLYNMTQDQLAHTLFPLGELTKEEVRSAAERAGLCVADKAESQDICFIPDGDYLGFIKKRTGCDLGPGDIVDLNGKVLGTHAGLAAYTIGQRKGIGIGGVAYPLFVVAKDLERNRLVVGPREAAVCSEITVRDVNLISIAQLTEPLHVQVKTFYRQAAVDAVIEPIEDVCENGGCLRVVFPQPVRACAAGQAAVFYDGDVVVGGGTIVGSSVVA